MMKSYNYEIRQKNKSTIEILYNAFLQAKDYDYARFIAHISDVMNKKVSIKTLTTAIDTIKTQYNSSKGQEMSLILDYVLAKESNSEKKEELKEKLDDKDKQRFKKENKKTSSQKFMENLHTKYINEVKDEIDTIISDNRSIEELREKGLVKRNELLTDAKKNLDIVGNKKYIEFLIKYHQIKKISYEELDQYKQVLEFFISHLQKTNLKLLNTDIETATLDEVKSIKVEGEDELTDLYKNSKGRLYSWKISKVERELKFYVLVYMNVVSFILNELDEFKELKAKYPDDLIMDCYNQMYEISSVYQRDIKKGRHIKEEEKDNLRYLYANSVFKESNN